MVIDVNGTKLAIQSFYELSKNGSINCFVDYFPTLKDGYLKRKVTGCPARNRSEPPRLYQGGNVLIDKNGDLDFYHISNKTFSYPTKKEYFIEFMKKNFENIKQQLLKQ